MSWLSTIVQYLGFGQYFASPPSPDADNLVPWQTDHATGALKVAITNYAWGLLTPYAVAGTWPPVVAPFALLAISAVPAAVLAMPAFCSWVIVNATSGAASLSALGTTHTVAAKTCVLWQTDASGVLTITSLTAVP